MRRIIAIAGSLLIIISVAATATTGKKPAVAGEAPAGEQWEYLVVASPSNINLTPSGNPNVRKEPAAGFGREAFVLEQNMDKLGAKGWELVSVAGAPSDPIYYFKRRK